ncbi:D-arabinono-1,4-lactone oxidase [Dietzia sp. SLG310A2-38A2]|uniref:D-arabinono-1,4-lactone oxidase n=1 Tax=Dietzia sp. SLG310A2-38A2 TaxID=1630643 RepID=UPI003218F09C
METRSNRRWCHIESEKFTNWSGSVEFTPRSRIRARDSAEVVSAVRRAREHGRSVRPVGSGHSSMPLVATDDVLLSVDDLSGVEATDPERGLATVLPGTGLADLGAELRESGLGLENLGDVDYQSIAGAIGTGTHGTGARLGNLSSTLVGGTLVTGTGDEVSFGHEAGATEENRGDSAHGRPEGVADDDLARAAQVSLGALGVFTRMTLRVRPYYELHRRNWMTHIDWVLDNYAELVDSHRHMDFYWYPRSDLAQVRLLDEPGREPDLRPPPGSLKTEETGPAYEILPNDRHLLFEEMEYALPLDTELAAFRRARERIKARHRSIVGWRVLVRTVAADQGLLSPFHGRPSMTIALLQNASLPHEEYFSDMEPLFLEHAGRPHWGKKHRLGADELAARYPEWDEFSRVRERLDPDGVFLNDHLRELLVTGTGPAAPGGR